MRLRLRGGTDFRPSGGNTVGDGGEQVTLGGSRGVKGRGQLLAAMVTQRPAHRRDREPGCHRLAGLGWSDTERLGSRRAMPRSSQGQAPTADQACKLAPGGG